MLLSVLLKYTAPRAFIAGVLVETGTTNEPVTLKEPVKLCTSPASLPKADEPLWKLVVM